MCVTMTALLNMVKHPAIAKKRNEVPWHSYLNMAASIGLDQSGTTGVGRVLLLRLSGLAWFREADQALMMDEGSMFVTMPALLNMVKHPAIAKKETRFHGTHT